MRFPETVPIPGIKHVCCRVSNGMRHRCKTDATSTISSATGGAASSILVSVPQYNVFNRHVDLAEQDAEAVRVAKARKLEAEQQRMERLLKNIPEETLLKLRNREEQTDKNLETFNNFTANAFKLDQLDAAQQASLERDDRERKRRKQIDANVHSVEENAEAFGTEQAAADVGNSQDALLEETSRIGEGDIDRSTSRSRHGSGTVNPYLSVLSDSYAEVALGVDRAAARKHRSLERVQKSTSDTLNLEREAEKAFREERTAAMHAGSDQWQREHLRGTHIMISE